MVTLPRKDFRGAALSFDEFYDLVIIGMVGLSDALMIDEKPAHVEGMVNYKRVAENLGLIYEPTWIDDVGYALENRLEAIASHDSSPEGEDNDSHWVYLNSGITRIGELLHEKYYALPASFELSYDEFRDAFIFELAGMVQDHITEDGISADREKALSYDLFVTADHLNLFHEPGWIDQLAEDFLAKGYIVAAPDTPNGVSRYRLTQSGYEHAQSLIETVGAADGMLLKRGQGTLYFSVDASHISRLGLELVAKQETAVAELVKNGYDADATNVDLIFSTGTGGQTSLEIYDNGSGMDIDQLEAGFMRLSTPNKVVTPRSDQYKRQKAGRKGIGRFAAQRLGRRLILETTTSRLHYGLRLDIDWEQFEAELNLTSVPSAITRIKKPFAQARAPSAAPPDRQSRRRLHRVGLSDLPPKGRRPPLPP